MKGRGVFFDGNSLISYRFAAWAAAKCRPATAARATTTTIGTAAATRPATRPVIVDAGVTAVF
jgi:hypothetical protein